MTLRRLLSLRAGLKKVASAILADVELRLSAQRNQRGSKGGLIQSGCSPAADVFSGRQDAALYGRPGGPPLLFGLTLSLLLVSALSVRAQFLPADDFFHRGAQSYITNNVAQAREVVDQGLKFYPDDAKLKKLDELLKQKDQQQQSQQNQKQDQKKQDQQQSQPKDQKQKPDKKDQPKPDQPKDKPEQKKSEPQKDQKAAAQEPKPDEKGKDGQMTPQEAKQLLDAQKNDELLMPANRKDKPPDPRKVVKDW